MHLIVGLGNPGPKYKNTRHNIGFMVIDWLAGHAGINVDKKQHQSHLGQGIINGKKVLLLKPQTYMNKSGEAVLETLNYYQEGIKELIIIHDDLDIEFGRLRFKGGGGAGGHNGLKSITQSLNSPDYERLKVGIGRPPSFMKVGNYVLSDFSPVEIKVLPQLLTVAGKGLLTWLEQGLLKSMNDYNNTLITLKEE